MKEDIAVKVQKQLFELQDLKYRDFHAKLMPTIDKEKVIGVRTPALRSYAKQFGKTEEAKEYSSREQAWSQPEDRDSVLCHGKCRGNRICAE